MISFEDFEKYLENEGLLNSYYPNQSSDTIYGVGCEWIIGGRCGRNCWEYRDEEVEAEYEKDNTDIFIKIFNYALPSLGGGDIVITKTEELKEKFEQRYESYMENYDYYGNYNDMAYKFVSISDMYAFLKNMGVYE